MYEREIVLGVSGGVAAYKAAMLASSLAQEGARVTAVMTAAATEFLGPTTLAALTGRPVCLQAMGDPLYPLGAHIELARRAQLLCIAPATANFLAKAAQGIADDLLSTLYLCFTGPVVIAPAMNNEMWAKPAVQRNVLALRGDGAFIVDPEEGWLSCRVSGPGRMADPARILDEIRTRLL